jgi:hypothetical protein
MVWFSGLLLRRSSTRFTFGWSLVHNVSVGVFPELFPALNHSKAFTSGFFIFLPVASRVSVYRDKVISPH